MILPIHPFSHEQKAVGTKKELIEVLIVDLWGYVHVIEVPSSCGILVERVGYILPEQ